MRGSVFGKCLLVLALWTFCAIAQVEYTDEELDAMLDSDLELLCVKRGFHLAKDDIDPNTGKPYVLAHEDYVEAAQRCLAIEKEMNELLAEFPELADEIEAEIAKMEAENKMKEDEVAKLQNELNDKEAGRADIPGSSSGAAFMQGSSDRNSARRNADSYASSDETDVLDLDSEGGGLQSGDESREKEDLTMRALTLEIFKGLMKQVKSDFGRIAELLTPALRPLIRAGDVTWRYIRAAILTLYKNSEKATGQESEETCDEVPPIN